MISLRLLAGIAVLTGCGMNSGPGSYKGRAAEATPSRFETDSNFARIAPEDTLPGSGCLSPLHDPRDGTRVIMRRSEPRTGDYEVPEGKYGVGPGELLRIDCNSGEALGIVRK
jgi:hypothetical protein